MSPCELDELRIVLEPDVQAVLEIESSRDTCAQQRAPVRRKASALSDDPDERGVRVEAKRVVDARDDRDAVLGLAGALRVEDRGDGLTPVAHDAAQGLAVMRVLGELLGEDEVTLLVHRGRLEPFRRRQHVCVDGRHAQRSKTRPNMTFAGGDASRQSDSPDASLNHSLRTTNYQLRTSRLAGRRARERRAACCASAS